MYFQQFYLGCLAHASYLIGADGEAAVVDPQRDVEQYLQEAAAQGFQITYIIETHLHADFVSGHRELAARTGADIVFGHRAGATVPHRAVHDGDALRLGSVTLRVLETPGHTPESISIVVIDHAVSEEPQKVLTGDTLFIGDVGRPDLAGAKGHTAAQMAGMLYESLHSKLLRLEDSVEVYPAHGAGSLCGRNMSQDTSSTIGEQKKFNYALQPIPKADFVHMMTTDLPEAPAYFLRDAEINRTGAAALADLPRPAALAPAEVHACAQREVVVLDVRPAAAFGAGHVPGAMNIGLGGQFASWAGRLLALETPLVIVAEDNAQVEEAVTRLARVGMEHVQGYLDGGMYAWHQAGLPVTTIAQIPVDELRHQLEEGQDVQVVDVRQPGEYASGHVPGAISLPLAHLAEGGAQLHPERSVVVICAGGYRSSAATGILARLGFTHLCNVVGGTSAWVNAGYQVEPVRATTS